MTAVEKRPRGEYTGAVLVSFAIAFIISIGAFIVFLLLGSEGSVSGFNFVFLLSVAFGLVLTFPCLIVGWISGLYFYDRRKHQLWLWVALGIMSSVPTMMFVKGLWPLLLLGGCVGGCVMCFFVRKIP